MTEHYKGSWWIEDWLAQVDVFRQLLATHNFYLPPPTPKKKTKKRKGKGKR